MKMSALILLLCVFLLTGPARADIYKWVDEHGTNHYGEAVPERYQAQQKRLELDHASSEVDRDDAIRRHRQARDALRSFETKRARDAKAERAKKRHPKTNAQHPNETACQKEWRLYLKAKACFRRYRSATGRIRAEAYQHCTDMAEPKTICPP